MLDLAALEMLAREAAARADAAESAPWAFSHEQDIYVWASPPNWGAGDLVAFSRCDIGSEDDWRAVVADCEFIGHARSDVPALAVGLLAACQRIRELETQHDKENKEAIVRMTTGEGPKRRYSSVPAMLGDFTRERAEETESALRRLCEAARNAPNRSAGLRAAVVKAEKLLGDNYA